MGIIILLSVTFFLTFTTINSINPYCAVNPTCQCAFVNKNQISFDCNLEDNTTYVIHVRSKDYLQIYCKNWKTWNNFNYTSVVGGNNVTWVQFKFCGISDEISLNSIVKRFGVNETKTLIFESSKNFDGQLKRKHFIGFENITKLVLSGNGLKNIPYNLFVSFPHLIWIDLSNNELETINNIFDVIPHIKRLDLSKNRLNSIDRKVFFKLKALEHLDLVGNYFERFQNNVFIDLVSLKALNLSNNNLEDFNEHFFGNIPNLEILDISFNSFYQLPKTIFYGATKLRELFIESNNKPMDSLEEDTFWNLTNLEVLSMKNLKLTVLEEKQFWNSTLLKYLNLGENMFKQLLPLTFKGLKNVEVLSLHDNNIAYLPENIFQDMEKLKKLILSDNSLTNITGKIFVGLKVLTELNLESNSINYLEEQALKPLKNLKIMKLSSNKLDFKADILNSTFEHNFNLEELYLGENLIQTYPLIWPVSLHKLHYLDLNQNKIENISMSQLFVPSINITIDLSYNRIKMIFFDKIEKRLESYFRLKRNITFHFYNNPILCNCQLYHLLRLFEHDMSYFNNSHFKIELRRSKCIDDDGHYKYEIKQLNSLTYKCNEHEYFNIENKCMIGCRCYIVPYNGTRIYDCSYQNLTEFVKTEVLNVNHLNHTFVLNLTGNHLTVLPSYELGKSVNKIHLLLSNNRIYYVDYREIPKNLEVLELHNNDIKSLSSDLLNTLSNENIKKLTLSGNPYKCDCYARGFHAFVDKYRNKHNDLNNVKCNGSDTPFFSVPFFALTCDSMFSIEVITYTFVTVVVITTIALIVKCQIEGLFRRRYRNRLDAGVLPRYEEVALRPLVTSSSTSGELPRYEEVSQRPAEPSQRPAEPSQRPAEPSPILAGSTPILAGLSLSAAGLSSRAAERSPSLAVPSSSAEGTSPSVPGPSASLAGPSASLAGPSASLAGPPSRAAGPSSSSAGPSSSAAGPSASLAGPSSSAAGPSASLAGPSSRAEVPSPKVTWLTPKPAGILSKAAALFPKTSPRSRKNDGNEREMATLKVPAIIIEAPSSSDEEAKVDTSNT